MNVRLYVWQRLTAAIMLPLVLAHVAMIFYATRTGMSAADILGRTRSSIGWAVFYTLFVVPAAIHAGICLRYCFAEWLPMGGPAAGMLAVVFGFLLLLFGLRAVAAVVLA